MLAEGEELHDRILAYYRSIRPPSPPLDRGKAVELIRQAIEQNLKACSPRNHGIVRVTAEPVLADEEYQPQDFGLGGESGWSAFVVTGIDGQGIGTLRLTLMFAPPWNVGIWIRSVNGKEAESVPFGTELTEEEGRDNPVIIPVLVLCLMVLYACGYTRFTNVPATDKLERLYRWVGFVNVDDPPPWHQLLDLTQETRAKQMVSFAASRIAAAGVDLAQLVFEA